MDKFILSVKIAKDDYKEFVKKTFWMNNVFLIILFVLLAAALSVYGFYIQKYSIIIISVIVLAAIALYHFTYIYVGGIKSYDARDMAKLTAVYTFTENKMYVKTDKGEVKISYSSLYKVISTKNTIVFLVNNKAGYMIPKKLLSGDKIDCINNILIANKPKKGFSIK